MERDIANYGPMTRFDTIKAKDLEYTVLDNACRAGGWQMVREGDERIGQKYNPEEMQPMLVFIGTEHCFIENDWQVMVEVW